MEEKEYHKQRRMFLTINDELVLPEKGLDKSHKEWLEANKYPNKEMERIIKTELRGVLNPDGEIRFYVGENREVNPETEKKFFEILPKLVEIFDLTPETIIGGGVNKGKIGEFWPARKVYGKVKNFIKK